MHIVFIYVLKEAVADDAPDRENEDYALVLTACLTWTAVPHGDGIPKVLFGGGTCGEYGSATTALVGDDEG